MSAAKAMYMASAAAAKQRQENSQALQSGRVI
jgi:hypothetical protein